MKKNFFIILLFSVFLTACQKNDVSKINILVTRTDNYGDYVSFNQNLLFHISAFSEKDLVQKITISSFDNEKGNIIVLDSIIHLSSVDFDFSYRTLSYLINDTTNLKLTFTAYTSDEIFTKMVHYVNVVGSASLESHDGLIMYSAKSLKPNGLNFDLLQTLYCNITDSSLIDIYDYETDPEDSTLLSREWRSFTNVLFVRYNDFDYANATKQSLYNAYTSGSKYNAIKNLMYGDILIVGRDISPLGVIQIVAIYDEEGNNNDRYVFNIKK